MAPTARAQPGREQQKRQAEVGDLLIAYLRQLSVEYVFGIPGGAIEPLYNALARSEREGGPRPVVARHETGAAFMADGYHRETGKIGVCCGTTGPGTTNLITGVASAYENFIPLLVITAQTALSTFGRGAFQESSCTGVNTVGMFQHCTRYNSFVSHVDQFERKLIAAVMSAFQSPAGPAHLSIPLDILRHPLASAEPTYNLQDLLQRPALIDAAAVADLRAELRRSRSIALVLGEGCSEAIGPILEFAAAFDAKIVTTPNGKGLISPYLSRYRGVVGFAGHQAADAALAETEVDTILAVGTGLSEWASDGWNAATLMNKRLIHIDSTELNLTRSPMAKLHVRGRISTIFEQLLKSAEPLRGRHTAKQDSKTARVSPEHGAPSRPFALDDEESYRSEAVPIKPQRLMRELARLFPPNTRYLADTGNSLAWAIHYLHVDSGAQATEREGAGNGAFMAALEFASMGWAISAAVGVAMGRRDTPVVCLTGDGSVLMSGQDITVAIQEKLPVIFVVLNDSALGMVRHGQALTGAEQVGSELPRIDFCGMGKAMGADAYVITSPRDLLDLDIGAICRRAGPTLLDVRIDPHEVPPMNTRVKVLNAVK